MGSAAAVAILGVGVAVGFLAGTSDDDGDAPSDSYSMAGVSMEPTFDHGEVVTANVADGAAVGRGDVVVLEVPGGGGNESTLTIKRVVAVAGDEVATTAGGEVTIDGEPADEPYLAPGTSTLAIVPSEVPEGHVFVLGDNRSNSTDSRIFGPVSYEAITALVET